MAATSATVYARACTGVRTSVRTSVHERKPRAEHFREQIVVLFGCSLSLEYPLQELIGEDKSHMDQQQFIDFWYCENGDITINVVTAQGEWAFTRCRLRRKAKMISILQTIRSSRLRWEIICECNEISFKSIGNLWCRHDWVVAFLQVPGIAFFNECVKYMESGGVRANRKPTVAKLRKL